MAKRPLPVCDTSTGEFWAGTRDGRLPIQRCKKCASYVFYPRYACPECWATELEWVDSGGRGTVYAFTVIQRSIWEDLPAPYVVALIELEEGVRMMSNIVDVDPAAVAVGMPVVVTYRKMSDEITLPFFTPEKK